MLSAEIVNEISEKVSIEGLSEMLIQDLRAAYPQMHFTYCMDDDITSGKPYSESNNFNVYLVDGRDHCLALTGDITIATGLVLAEVIAE